MRLNEPSGSSHVSNLMPVIETRSMCARRVARSTVVPVTASAGTVIQSVSESLGRTVRSLNAIFETST